MNTLLDHYSILRSGDVNKMKKGLENLPNQDEDLIVQWTADFRMTHLKHQETHPNQPSPILEFLVQGGFIPCALKLISHTFDKTKNSEGPRFYPCYAAELLSHVLTNPNSRKTAQYAHMLVDEYHGLPIIIKAIEHSLMTVKYFCLSIISCLSMTTKYGINGNLLQSDLQTLPTLLRVAKLPNNAFEQELNSDRGHHQVDIVKRWQSLEVALEYAPRYMEVVYEMCALTLCGLLAIQCDQESVRTAYIETPGFVDHALNMIVAPTPEAYPTSTVSSLYAEALACLTYLPVDFSPMNARSYLEYSKEDYKSSPTINNLKTIKTLIENEPDFIPRLIECLKTIRDIEKPMEQLAEIMPKAAKYHPDVEPSMEEITECATHLFDTEQLLLASLSNLTEVPEYAEQIYKYRDGIVEEMTRNFLFGDHPHDQAIKMVGEQGGHLEVVFKGVRINEDDDFRFTFFCPTQHECALQILTNIWRFNNLDDFLSESPTDNKYTQVKDKILEHTEMLKNRANKDYFLKKDYGAAIRCYAMCMRLLVPEFVDVSTDAQEKKVILLSNQAEAFLRSKQFQEAFDATKKALEINPDHKKSQNRQERAQKRL